MRIPFEKLMEAVATLSEADSQLTLGEVAKQLGEPDAWRVADAIIAVRVASGERTYIEFLADAQPVVRQAMDEDRGSIITGAAPPAPGASGYSAPLVPRRPRPAQAGGGAGPGTRRSSRPAGP